MNTDIFSFMENHGVSLKDSGSAERGFTQAEVLDLLNILSEKNIKPLGLEVWHRRGDGRFSMDSLAGWVSVTSSDIDTLFTEVKEVMRAENKKSPSIFTLQF
jgi:hypothetical protein